jgi:multimeric flavodoxin WrbA
LKIVIVTGTPVKGCTCRLKEIFREAVREGNEVTEFTLSRDMPEFCVGCKNCFFRGEDQCPHARYTMPIWRAMLAADLIAFVYPVYALRAPGSVKALLDHFCVHWIVHRPEKAMLRGKRVAILTNSIGAPNGAAQKDVATSFSWMGVSDIKRQGFGLMEGVDWDRLSAKRRRGMEEKTVRFAKRCVRPVKKGMCLKVKAFFALARALHRSGYKKAIARGETPCLDDAHWSDNGWFRE